MRAVPVGYFESDEREKMESPEEDATESRFSRVLGGSKKSASSFPASLYKTIDPRWVGLRAAKGDVSA